MNDVLKSIDKLSHAPRFVTRNTIGAIVCGADEEAVKSPRKKSGFDYAWSNPTLETECFVSGNKLKNRWSL